MQEKLPWKALPPLTASVERQFLRPALLGESIAPYRVLAWPEAVVPMDGIPLSSEAAAARGYAGLASWLANAEIIWNEHSAQTLTFVERLDFWGELSAQFPLQRLRAIFTASGTNAAATILESDQAVLEHKLYWCSVADRMEGLYLCSIINSEMTKRAIEHLQSRGQWGARDFDKVMFTLPIPRFKMDNGLHSDLVDAAAHAESVAAIVEIPESTGFIGARQAIRAALQDDGVAARIDRLVARLLFGEDK